MTLKIESIEGRIRLSGEFRSEHLDQVKAEIDRRGSPVVLDLEELTSVDVNGIRFLNACEAKGISVSHCSPYVKASMSAEREEKGTVTMEMKTHVPLTEPGADEASRSGVMAAAPEERFHSFGPAVESFGEVSCGVTPMMTSCVRTATRREEQCGPFKDAPASEVYR